jgi:hypothetical protein
MTVTLLRRTSGSKFRRGRRRLRSWQEGGTDNGERGVPRVRPDRTRLSRHRRIPVFRTPFPSLEVSLTGL